MGMDFPPGIGALPERRLGAGRRGAYHLCSAARWAERERRDRQMAHEWGSKGAHDLGRRAPSLKPNRDRRRAGVHEGKLERGLGLPCEAGDAQAGGALPVLKALRFAPQKDPQSRVGSARIAAGLVRSPAPIVALAQMRLPV